MTNSNVMNALGSYETWKTLGSSIILLLCMCCAIGITIYNWNQNYQSTKDCDIALNSDLLNETLTYTVNNKKYTYPISPTTTTTNNRTTTQPTYKAGPCTLYYKGADPTSYSVNYNPTTISAIISGILCCLAVFTFIWFLFLRANPEVAGVVGSIDAASTVIGSFNKN